MKEKIITRTGRITITEPTILNVMVEFRTYIISILIYFFQQRHLTKSKSMLYI